MLTIWQREHKSRESKIDCHMYFFFCFSCFFLETALQARAKEKEKKKSHDSRGFVGTVR